MRLSRTRSIALVVAAVTAATAPTGAPARAAADDTTRPSTPGPLQIAEITETTIRLTWEASTDDVGVASYEVLQWYSDYGVRYTAPTNEFFSNTLRASHTYYWTVAALDAAGNRSPQVSLRVTMPPGDDEPPTAPGAPVATELGDTWMQLTWPAATDNVYVAAYTVHQIEGDVVSVIGTVPQHPPIGPTFRVRGLSPDTSYSFVVRARDDVGNASQFSPIGTFRTRPADAEPPSAPGTPRASEVTPTSVLLSWDLSTDDVWVARYVVVDRLTGVELRTTTYNETRVEVEPNTRYEFVVYAEDAVGKRSSASGVLAMTTPELVTCAVTYQITAQWSGGFQADVAVRNTGPSTIDGWAVAWTFPTGQHIRHIWSAVADDATGPEVTVHNQSWNGRLAPGGEAWFGFQGSWSGENQVPYGFVLNGVPCQVD